MMAGWEHRGLEFENTWWSRYYSLIFVLFFLFGMASTGACNTTTSLYRKKGLDSARPRK